LLDDLLSAVRRGESRSLVLRGEAGIGKTTLLAYLVESASDLTVLRAAGVESEMELAYASLQQLCAPLLGLLGRVPEPQSEALQMVFGLKRAASPDRFLVGLATLSLFSEAAAERPLLCVVDDAQWLDQASALTLAFVARRLLADRVAIVFGAREPGDGIEHLTQLEVLGLRNGDARALLDLALPVKLDERIRDRTIAESRGNPLALLELPRGLTPAELAGGIGLAVGQPVSGRLEQNFLRRVETLSDEARFLLLLAAAEPTGDPLLLLRACELLGIGIAAIDAETDGLLEIRERVTFRHPLVRSAIYRSAPVQERRKVHSALAAATDRTLDPDRLAWHLAAAAHRPDEDVAVQLERSARRAQARGGLSAAAAFLQRAANLTPDPSARARRALAAAQAEVQAGAFDTALALLASADAGPLGELERAQAELLRGQIAFVTKRGGDAPLLLLRAARRLEPLDDRLARASYLEALTAAMYAGRLAAGCSPREVGEAVIAATGGPHSAGAADLLLDGLALLTTAGYAPAAATLKRAVSAFRGNNVSAEELTAWLWLACPAAQILWDDEGWDVLSRRHAQLAREAGALGVVPMALSQRATLHVLTGDLGAGASLVEELAGIVNATGRQLPPYAPVMLAAFRGREPEASALMEQSATDLLSRGEGAGLTYVQWARAALYNGLGRYEEAVAVAQQPAGDRDEYRFSPWLAVELIEAATRSGSHELGSRAVERLVDSTQASGSEWAGGIEARSRALLTNGEIAERFYREAIERLGRTTLRPELARAHLLFGEWLRRAGRRKAARDELRAAHAMFTDMGMEGFAKRTCRELLATGERLRRRAVETRDDLTPQERQIAELACDGLSNPEISARLFLSPRTVEWHLQKVFGKLGIHRRRELAEALAGCHSEPRPA
jgi:DNA-binding CsgD family transcriptional regulator